MRRIWDLFTAGARPGIGLTKNKYIGRTYIAPEQKERETGVSIKLNPIRDAVNGKRLVLIDDSIVRGTTCRHIVELLRSAGAREIHMRVSAPPFIAPCYYGTDIDNPDGLIANRHAVGEIARIIGVDSLGYLSIEYQSSFSYPYCLANTDLYSYSIAISRSKKAYMKFQSLPCQNAF